MKSNWRLTMTEGATFGTILREARLAAGFSQADLSERSGLPKPTLSRYENGHVLPSLLTLRRLADALSVLADVDHVNADKPVVAPHEGAAA